MDHAKSVLRQRTRRRHRVRKPLRGHLSGHGYRCRSHKHIYAKSLMTHRGRRSLQLLPSSRKSSQAWILVVIVTPLLPSVRLLPNGRKQQGYHESVLIVVRAGITVVSQRWPMLHVKQDWNSKQNFLGD